MYDHSGYTKFFLVVLRLGISHIVIGHEAAALILSVPLKVFTKWLHDHPYGGQIGDFYIKVERRANKSAEVLARREAENPQAIEKLRRQASLDLSPIQPK